MAKNMWNNSFVAVATPLRKKMAFNRHEACEPLDEGHGDLMAKIEDQVMWMPTRWKGRKILGGISPTHMAKCRWL